MLAFSESVWVVILGGASAVGTVIVLLVKIAIELGGMKMKMDLMWQAYMHNAHVEASTDGVEKGLFVKNSPLTITEISNLLKRTVEDRFGFVRLRGELSGVKRAASGHLYCCLKDEGAVIDGVMWRGGAQRLGFMPEDGIEVVASGKLTTYPGRSKYQIVIESMEIAGEGALLALLEKTRRRLEAEGLFASERKRALPFLPGVIGVVTSPTGAVIRDILHRLEDRFPGSPAPFHKRYLLKCLGEPVRRQMQVVVKG